MISFPQRRTLLAAIVLSGATQSEAFSVSKRTGVVNAQGITQKSSQLRAIAIDEASAPSTSTGSPTPKNGGNNGMLPDFNGVALSGLKGQALSIKETPLAKDLKAVIPKDCFTSDTATSLGYLSVSVAGTALCSAIGFQLLSFGLNPANPLTWPLWTAYSAVTGTVAMGLWVLAHECGHGAFSKNKDLQDAVGYTLHSLFLVPYFSWQRSHAVHHQYTNHVELGETHVPEREELEGKQSLQLREWCMKSFGEEKGLQAFGVLQLFLHLVIGWPAYLLIGATGGHDRGLTNHYYPNPLSTPNQPKKELFPGNWKEKVYQSDIGIAAVLGMVVAATAVAGPAPVMALYGGPLLVVNAWLVLYTWLQHTDVDIPHFSAKHDYSFVKGALHTVDRPYDKLDPWGVIDFLHHSIGTTHVAHHFDSTIPHYKARAATEAIRKNFPEYYLYDPTPIPQAVWRIARGCTAVEERDGYWIWTNKGTEKYLEDNNPN